MYISYVGLLDRACDNMHNINIMNNNPKISLDFVHVPVLVLYVVASVLNLVLNL